MDKEQTIAFIEGQLATGKISKGDLLAIAGDTSLVASGGVTKQETSHSLINIFYTIGAIIALGGVVTLVSQNWNQIGFLGRIVVTLGISCVTYLLAMLVQNKEQRILTQVLFVMSAVLAPLGVFVFFDEYGIELTHLIQIIVSLFLAIMYGLAFFVRRRSILVLITTAFASWAYYATILKLLDTNFDNDYLKWATIILGLAYILVAYAYKKSTTLDIQDVKEKRFTENTLFGFGTIGVLGAGMALGDAYTVLMIIPIFAAFYGSVYVRSRTMLGVAGLFLIAEIVKITSQYFADSVSWPVALIGMGFLIIGIGYATFYINKKFITS